MCHRIPGYYSDPVRCCIRHYAGQHPAVQKVQAALDRVTGMTRENLNGVRVIRAFCREEQSVADFEKSNDELTCLNEFVGKFPHC